MDVSEAVEEFSIQLSFTLEKANKIVGSVCDFISQPLSLLTCFGIATYVVILPSITARGWHTIELLSLNPKSLMLTPHQRHSHLVTVLCRYQQPTNNPQILGILEQNYYRAFTRPFFFTTQISKRRKSDLATPD